MYEKKFHLWGVSSRYRCVHIIDGQESSWSDVYESVVEHARDVLWSTYSVEMP